MSIENAFPSLREAGYRVTSPASSVYNCIAWAAEEDGRWWWPDPRGFYYWPQDVPRTDALESFIHAFGVLGFVSCGEAAEVEAEHEKVALYGKEGRVKHAARQLPDGRWTSKLGQNIDIEHSLEALTGRIHGSVIAILRRRRQAST